MVSLKSALLVAAVAGLESSNAFVAQSSCAGRTSVQLFASSQDDASTQQQNSDRRSFLTSAALLTASAFSAPVLAEQAPEYRQGIKVDAFNGLIFNYRGGDYNGLEGSEINEPSVSYADFNDRLKKGEVEFVEFLAPDGDKAYVTFKNASGGESGSTKQSPVRIGEGYPIEQHDGYSSPMFAVRAVKNAGVPYKFVVPGLSKYTSASS